MIIPRFAIFLLPVALALWGPDVPGWMTIVNVAARIVGRAGASHNRRVDTAYFRGLATTFGSAFDNRGFGNCPPAGAVHQGQSSSEGP